MSHLDSDEAYGCEFRLYPSHVSVGAAFILETGPHTRHRLSSSLSIYTPSSKKEETVIKSEDEPSALGHQSELPDVATSNLTKVGLGNVVLIL